MKEFEVEKKSCRNCGSSMEINFFVYSTDSESYDYWLDSVDLVRSYCDRCFREIPKVMLFVEIFCSECGNYAGVYMECTPYSKAHILAEISATSHR